MRPPQLKAIASGSKRKSKSDPKEDPYQATSKYPEDEEAWRTIERNGKLASDTINTITKHCESQISGKRFLMLRAIFPEPKPYEELKACLADYGLNTFWDDAVALVARSDEMHQYFAVVARQRSISIEEKDPNKHLVGVMPARSVLEEAGVSRAHKDVSPSLPLNRSQKTDGTDSSTMDGVQEAKLIVASGMKLGLVNLIMLLNGITRSAPSNSHGKPSWSMIPERLKAEVHGIDLTVVTDGFLHDERRHIMALINAGDTILDKKAQMLETATMVAWIKTNGEPLGTFNGCRLSLSQNLDEIYIKFAHYEDKYRDYLDGKGSCGEGSREAYMEIRTFGPWNIQSATDMENFACVLMVIVLHVQQVQEQQV